MQTAHPAPGDASRVSPRSRQHQKPPPALSAPNAPVEDPEHPMTLALRTIEACKGINETERGRAILRRTRICVSRAHAGNPSYAPAVLCAADVAKQWGSIGHTAYALCLLDIALSRVSSDALRTKMADAILAAKLGGASWRECCCTGVLKMFSGTSEFPEVMAGAVSHAADGPADRSLRAIVQRAA